MNINRYDPLFKNKIKSENDIFEKIMFNESILDPIKKELNQDIFNKDKLNKDVKEYILDIFYNWKTKYIPEGDVASIILLGSSAGYQYNDSSDIDVNVIFKNKTQEELKQVTKYLPNGNMLFDTEHPINFYVDINDENVKQADNAYDILNDGWIKYPSISDTKIPYSYALEIAKFFMNGIDIKITEYESDVKEYDYYSELIKAESDIDADDIQKRLNIKKEEILADLDALYVAHHILRSFRKEAFDKTTGMKFLISIDDESPNYSINNIVYKMLESFGYFEKLEKYENERKKYETRN